jgi:hypothetical protein
LETMYKPFDCLVVPTPFQLKWYITNTIIPDLIFTAIIRASLLISL